jgi:hypothetical protein
VAGPAIDLEASMSGPFGRSRPSRFADFKQNLQRYAELKEQAAVAEKLHQARLAEIAKSRGGGDGQMPASDKPIPASALESLLDKETLEALQIATSGVALDDKLRALCGIDRRFLHWTSPQLAVLCSSSSAAVRKTSFWKQDRKRALDAEKDLKPDS